jgi:hypothetical protein
LRGVLTDVRWTAPTDRLCVHDRMTGVLKEAGGEVVLGAYVDPDGHSILL